MTASDFKVQSFYEFVKIASKDTILIELQDSLSQEYITEETERIAKQLIEARAKAVVEAPEYEPITEDEYN